MIEGAKAGVCVLSDDAIALAQAMEDMADSGQRRSSMNARGRYVLEHHNRSALVAELLCALDTAHATYSKR
jgi:glycosyltransferase involved in cell wall biosynthesis